jgi:hypothetical protein
MAYLVVADVREATLAEFASGLALSTAEATDTQVTAAIARQSQHFDDLVNDHFETETVTLELDGDGTSRLLLPKRCTAVSTVKTRDYAGTLTTQASTQYRLHSSLYSTGSKRLGDMDWLDTVPLSGGLSLVVGDIYAWPEGPQTVQVVGSFGWTTTPADVKRAVALLVWDHFKPDDEHIRRASQWGTQQATFVRSDGATGLPEVDKIVDDYKRDITVGIG